MATYGIGVVPKVAQASALWVAQLGSRHRLEACATLPLAQFRSPGAGEIGWHAFRLLGTLGLSVLVIWLVIRIIKQD